MYYIGIDIGGTKCAVSLGDIQGDQIEVVDKLKFPTESKRPEEVLDEFLCNLNRILETKGLKYADIHGIGISCGGPLNSRTGVIMAPPNLPQWDNIHVVEFFEKATGIKTYLQNDANACAVAEWKFGAGRGYNNLAFLTFGTGLGAGLILDGRLYSGYSDMAGEIGHIRLTDETGPVGYNKAGSAEGWCSGGGIAQIGVRMVKAEMEKGNTPLIYERAGGDFSKITAKLIGDLAEQEGDPLSIEIYRISGEKLGIALSYLIDIINPEVIIIGGVFARSRDLLYPACREVIERECLVPCDVIGAGLGEKVGDYAALSVAMMND